MIRKAVEQQRTIRSMNDIIGGWDNSRAGTLFPICALRQYNGCLARKKVRAQLLGLRANSFRMVVPAGYFLPAVVVVVVVSLV